MVRLPQAGSGWGDAISRCSTHECGLPCSSAHVLSQQCVAALAHSLPANYLPCGPPFRLRERPSLVGKSSTKQAVQQKRKAQHAQQGQRKQRGGGSGAQQQNAQHGGKKMPRTAGKQLMSGGGMYNLA